MTQRFDQPCGSGRRGAIRFVGDARDAARAPMEQIGFLDFEASGLGARSWPIEVGWARFGGAASSLLIAPEPGWTVEAWDPRAEALHGLSRKTLKARGLEPADVCARLNVELSGFTVVSDAPDYDAHWLATLYRAAGQRPTFLIVDLLDAIARFGGGAALSDAIAEADRRQPHTHRAAQDVRNLQLIFDVCRRCASADR
ncbi:MAG: hypothetical protein AAF527_01165 [Pseudomonadota bacterium]